MLEAPDLDDRRFQDLVNEAKMMVQQRCPVWTDHNVSDPGVTLIETFAYMVDQLLYRLNRVPDRLYVKFLELIGEQLEPPAAASVDLTFYLSAPLAIDKVVPADTVVSTGKRGTAEPIEFSTVRDLVIPTCRIHRCAVQQAGSDPVVVDLEGLSSAGFEVFSTVPQIGDQLLVGLDRAVPSGLVKVAFQCTLEGHGATKAVPPLHWAAWTGRPEQPWEPCEVLEDTTIALNQNGWVLLQLPAGHTASSLSTGSGGVVDDTEAGWLACVVEDGLDDGNDYGAYTDSPRVRSLTAQTLGATVPAVNARRVTGEVLGVSDGTPGQRFSLQRRPVVLPSDEPLVVQVVAAEGTTDWTQVTSFGGSGPYDCHVVLDLHAGDVLFGPAVRLSDGTLRGDGAAPPKGASVRVSAYRFGGGARGNVAARQVTERHAGLPFVNRVENRAAAEGGKDAETMEAVKVRGPVAIRTRERAVTARDYEELARRAEPHLRRVRAIGQEAAGGPRGADPEAGTVRVLLVPPVTPGPLGQLALADLVPSQALVDKVRGALDEQRCLGTRLVVEAPYYQGIKVVTTLHSAPRVLPEVVQQAALRALYELLCPVAADPDEEGGWPFDKPVLAGRIHALLEAVPGCVLVDSLQVMTADEGGAVGDATDRIHLAPDTLVLSVEHVVHVAPAKGVR